MDLKASDYPNVLLQPFHLNSEMGVLCHFILFHPVSFMRGTFLSDRVINRLHFLSLWVFPWVSLSVATTAVEKAKAVTQQRDLNSPECSPNSDEPLTWINGYSEHRGHRFGLLQSELGCEILLLSKPHQAS